MKPIFKDFDLRFKKHPLTGDVIKSNDLNMIIQIIKNVMFSQEFLTFPYSSDGGELLSLLLTPNTEILVPRIVARTKYLLDKHVKIINVTNVKVVQSVDSIDIDIEFTANNDIDLLSTKIIFDRVR